MLVWPELSHRHRPTAGASCLASLLLQTASLGWSIGSAYSRRFAREDHVLGTTALQMLAGGVFLGALGLVRGELAHLAFNTRTTMALVYLATVGAIGGFVAYTYALRHLPVSFVSLYAYINPIIAVALGVLFLGEPFNARIAAAAALVLVGVAVVRLEAGGKRRGPTRAGSALRA